MTASKLTRDISSTQNQNSTIKPVHPAIEDYLFNLFAKHDESVLLEMETLARERNFPIVGRLVGPMLELLAKAVGAGRVFEFGSGYGYSAYWFTRAVGKNGKVICTEGSQENVDRALHYFKKCGRDHLVEYHCGWAQEVFKKTEGEFDVIYNDVDKDAYPEVWKLARERIRPGGLYIADNTLWSGRVTMANPEKSDVYPGWTEAIKEHNLLIAGDPDFDFFMNPIRDGVIVARKK